jgi:hypothetical protein
MGLFDVLKNLDTDAIVKGIDDLEQAIGKVVDNVDSAAAKVEGTAKVVEDKLVQSSGGAPVDDTKDASNN